MNPALHVRKLSYAYQTTHVLDGLSFTVRQGEFFIIIGPNGSGKTTLARIIAGLLKPKQGEIDIFGRPITAYGRKERARRIAFVPQLIPMNFPFAVKDAVLFGRTPHLGVFGLATDADAALARRAMAFTEVDHLADRRLDQLSGGERQRVFIARAICQDPEIMILDEPTASLDLAHQLRIMDLMEKMKAEKKITVVMVSHDLNLAAMYADTLLLIHRGRIAQCGSPAKVLTYETLETVYGCTLLVDENPLDRFPRVTPVPGRYIQQQSNPGEFRNRPD
jgi:iron complex transport system ATP-binding protein